MIAVSLLAGQEYFIPTWSLPGTHDPIERFCNIHTVVGLSLVRWNSGRLSDGILWTADVSQVAFLAVILDAIGLVAFSLTHNFFLLILTGILGRSMLPDDRRADLEQGTLFRMRTGV